jgi:lia operon protein LiaG
MRGMAFVAAALLTVPVGAQEVERLSGRDVAVYNLAGRVEIVRGSESDVVVRIDRGGADARDLMIETGEIRGRSTLRIVYPDDEIVYPEMGRGSNSSQSVRADGTFGDGGGRGDRVRISGRGSGIEAWADLVIEVPSDRNFAMYLAVGEIDARELDGHIRLDTGSGRVTAADIRGALDVDTGSGRVEVRGVDGDLRVDTGSGRIDVFDVIGREIELDTGSGGITAAGLEADALNVDTGSGSVELTEVVSRDVVVDTGSGSVELELLTDIDVLEVDTGSGSVTVRAPEDLGAMVEIDTGSGGIDLDFPLEVRSVRRDHVEGRIGDGRGQIEIDTGSGSIEILQGRARVR